MEVFKKLILHLTYSCCAFPNINGSRSTIPKALVYLLNFLSVD